MASSPELKPSEKLEFKKKKEEIKSNTRATTQTLQALVSMAHVKVHENIIRNRMKK